MIYDFSQFQEKIGGVEDWLSREFSMIRTGRATSVILDNVKVDSYGAKVVISHVAGISTEDAKTLRVTPWDKGQIKDIEQAIISSDLGISVVADDQGLRVIFPELTGERRSALIKLMKEKLEEARISLRGGRDEVWDDIQEKEKTGALSEDEKFHAKDEMEKRVSDTNKKLDVMAEKKEKEISN